MSPGAGDIPKRAHSAVNSWREVRNAINVLNQRIDELIPGSGGVTAPDDPAYLLENFSDGSYPLLPNRRRLVQGANISLSDGGAAGDLTVAATGDVTAAAVLTDHALLRGDGGAKGIQSRGASLDDNDGILCKHIKPSHATNPVAATGNIWYNETTKTHRLNADDAIHNIVGAEALTASDDEVVNTTVETIFADTKVIKANSLVIGASYEFLAFGKLSTDATIDYTFRLKLNSTTVVDSGALTQTSVSGGWFLRGAFTIRSIGVFGTVQGNAEVGYPRGNSRPIYTASPATSIDSTITLTFGVSVQMSALGASKSATLQQLILKKVS